MTLIDHELWSAIQCAKEASILAKKYYSETIIKKHKKDGSLFTKADINLNKLIIKKLCKSFPYPILSEESPSYNDYNCTEKIWIIDPLDGTKEFINGNDEFTINIALVKYGRPIIGVIAAPMFNKIFIASKGKGAYLIKDKAKLKIRTSKNNDINKFSLVVSRSHLHQNIQNLIDRCIFKKGVKITHQGSAIKYCLIADGTIDASIRKTPLMKWDICAADCILHEAGGILTDLSGKTLIYNNKNLKFTNGILATNRLILHKKIIKLAHKNI